MKAIRFMIAGIVATAALTAAGASVAGAAPPSPAPAPTGILQGLPPGYFNLPAVQAGTQTQAEGNHGWSDLNVPVTLSKPSTSTVTVDYRTIYLFGPIRHEAIPFLDYRRTHGTLTFAPGETSKMVSISIRGDYFPEHDNVFVVQFGRPHNARMGGFWGLGFGKIVNDDHFWWWLFD